MNLGESVRHVPVGVVILPFSVLLFHIKKRVLHEDKNGNGAELLVALCFQYSAPRCFLSATEGRAYLYYY
jgi:hypothetical protein